MGGGFKKQASSGRVIHSLETVMASWTEPGRLRGCPPVRNRAESSHKEVGSQEPSFLLPFLLSVLEKTWRLLSQFTEGITENWLRKEEAQCPGSQREAAG
jgi:hypothetical protein